MIRAFAFSALAALLPPLPAAAAAGPAAAEIGRLSLAHDPAEWRIEGGDGRYTIACIAETCAGAVLSVTVAEATDRCDEMVLRDRLRAAFPGLRHAVNMQAINGLAVYFGEAGAAARSLDEGDAVFACLDREGLRYEFVSIDGRDPRSHAYEGTVLELLRGLSAAPAAEHVLSLGGLSVRYTADRWQGPNPDLREEDDRGVRVLTCLPPFCNGTASLYFTRSPESEDVCASVLDARHSDVERSALTSAGRLDVAIATIHSGCRAWSPPQYVACVVHDGSTYALWTGLDSGCYRGRGFIGDDMFLEIVRTLAPE